MTTTTLLLTQIMTFERIAVQYNQCHCVYTSGTILLPNIHLLLMATNTRNANTYSYKLIGLDMTKGY